MGAAVAPRSRRFSISEFALIIPWVALVIDAWGPIRDNSFLWHVRAGSLQAGQGEVLTSDPFSFTRAGEEWLTQSWLAELLYAWAERLSGLSFVPWMLLVVSSLTFLGVGLIAHRRSSSTTATAFVLVLTTLLLISFVVPRPVIFSFLIFVLVILAWDLPRLRWALPFLFWLWASVHGSFVIGLVYIGLTIIMRSEWKALRFAIVSGLGTLVTAHGLGVIEVISEFAQAGDSLAFLTEWRRPTFDSPVFLPFIGGVVFLVIGAYRRLIEPRHLWIIVPFLLLGFSSIRAVPPAWLAIVPLVSLALSDMELGTKNRLSMTSATVFAVAVLLMPFLLIEEPTVSNDRFPVTARHELDNVRTFHDDRVGGYLIWAEWPDHLVYLDDRAELYDSRIEEFVEVRNGERDWRPVFERDRIGQALLASEEMLVDELKSEGWNLVFQDEDWVVLRPSQEVG